MSWDNEYYQFYKNAPPAFDLLLLLLVGNGDLLTSGGGQERGLKQAFQNIFLAFIVCGYVPEERSILSLLALNLKTMLASVLAQDLILISAPSTQALK